MDIHDLKKKEELAEKGLSKELQEHVSACMQALNLTQRVLESIPAQSIDSVPQSKKSCICLLTRLQNDLRSSWLLATQGYGTQAAGLVSSMIEVAWTVATIGSDETVAKAWGGHADPTQPFRNVRSLIHSGLKTMKHPDSAKQVVVEYRTYRQLCMLKHANPLYEKDHGIYFDGKSYIAFAGPDTSNASIRSSWFALEHAVNAIYISLSVFVRHHISDLLKEQFIGDIARLGESRKALECRAKERWGNKNPFPGKL